MTAKGHTLIDRERYLPFDWCEDRDRCRAAGIPDSVRFQTKPELAQKMIERIFQAQIPISWVVADTALRWESGPAYPIGSAWVSLRDGCSLQGTGWIPDTDWTQARRGCGGRSARPS